NGREFKDLTTTSTAAFAQGTFNFTDRFSGTLGLRWSKDQKDYTNFRSTRNIIAGVPTPYTAPDGEWTDVSPRFGLEQRWTPDVMTYLSVAKGYKAGGLNEYGIASYKATDDFAQAEVDWLLRIGGIEVRTGVELGRDLTLEALQAQYDAVFLGIGLAGVNALRAEGEEMPGVRDAVDFIAELRQTADLSRLPVGRDVVVIGGGMTAVDAAVQSKLLGAETVTIVYRRGRDRMSASGHEQDHAVQAGVRIIHNAAPLRVLGNGAAQAVEFAYTEDGPDGLVLASETFTLKADQVFKAIGQTLKGAPEGLTVTGGKISPSGARVWAGGDCAAGGEDLTVTAVAEGRDAAEAIHRHLTGRA
ncbi:MAG: TonB-dependent receptor, partial [Tabrizicola sp.]|nr:TonB-dependent receptor [Tabrizicola sp.]